MKQKGCAVTTAAMLLSMMIARLPDGSTPTPGNLNAYLKARPDGYSNHDVNFAVIASLVGAKSVSQATARSAVDAELAAGRPVILRVPGHFVLATGRVYRNGAWTYSINDPGYTTNGYLDDPKYNNQFESARIFDWSGGQIYAAPAVVNDGRLWVDVAGIQSLDVLDPLGRHSDASRGPLIPGTVAGSGGGLVDDTGPDSLGDATLMTRNVEVRTPLNGTYSVQLTGSGGDVAHLTAFGYDSLGVLNMVQSAQVQLSPNGTGEVQLTYSSSPGTSEVPWSQPTKPGLALNLSSTEKNLAIEFTLPREGDARILVFDVTGRLVGVVLDKRLSAGDHRFLWTGTTSPETPSGMYFVQLQFGADRVTGKVVLLH